jgi:methylase of polypeptide subunit release factors
MLRSLSTDEARDIRQFLRDSGYSVQALKARFGQTELPHVQLLTLYLAGVALEPTRLNLLMRWFWVGGAVEAVAPRELVPERMVELFVSSGILTAEDGFLRSPFRISPFNELLILSDHAVPAAGPSLSDMVIWPNQTTRLCYDMSLRSPVSRTLDLGTGTGVLAFSAAAHSGSVVATDLNPRARQFCEFNAALNGVSNIEFREGNSFEPVRGQRFDLILANPPFVVTPTVRRVSTDNSMELDGFCRSLVRQAPEYLNENGYCQMLGEWVQVKGQSWRERMGEWFAGVGCDVWVMVSSMRSSLDYALARVQEDHENALTQDALTPWLKYFENHQVEAIYGGMMVLRRRDGRNWVRMEVLSSVPARPFGEFLQRIFQARDYLESHSDEELLETRPTVPAASRLKQQFARSAEGWRLSSLELQPGDGLPYSLALQPQVSDLVALCDGKRTLREIADHFSVAMSIDPAVMRHESCAIIRRVADRGMVTI